MSHSSRWSHLASKNDRKHTHDRDSAAHRVLRSKNSAHHSHPAHVAKDASSDAHVANDARSDGQVPGIEKQTSTGVLYVSERASANGWEGPADTSFANLGQGAPETGMLPGGVDRIRFIDVDALGGTDLHEYASPNGVRKLREAVAGYYNSQYRVGKASQYTWENVAITPGGRAGLTRIASIIGPVYTSFQVPEYSAYTSLLSAFKRLIPVPMALKAEDGYTLNVEKLKDLIAEQGLGVVMLSNPRNPTGQVIEGAELEKLVQLGQTGTTMIIDEFYSEYIYDRGEGATISAAEFIDDVNKDAIVLINGLTKNFRYPGWRVAWCVGPKSVIQGLGSQGGSLDGGANHLLQVAALPLFEKDRLLKDRLALQIHFKMKRDYCLERLRKMGLEVKVPPTSTFYIWLDLSVLPSPINNGLSFFEECLLEKVIMVPGIFFDISPVLRFNIFDSPCHHFVRLSFGPTLETLKQGMDGIERVLKKMEVHVSEGGDIHDLVGRDIKQ